MKKLTAVLFLAVTFLNPSAHAGHDYTTLADDIFKCRLTSGSTDFDATLDHWFGQSRADAHRREVVRFTLENATFAVMAKTFGAAGYDTSGTNDFTFSDNDLAVGAAESAYTGTSFDKKGQWFDDGDIGYNLNQKIQITQLNELVYSAHVEFTTDSTGDKKVTFDGKCTKQ